MKLTDWKTWLSVLLIASTAGWMVFDGTRALILGDYVTPQTGDFAGRLGPWSNLVQAVGIEPSINVSKIANDNGLTTLCAFFDAQARGLRGKVHMRCTLGTLIRKERLEGLIDDLGNGQVVEVGLAPDRLDPAAFDMEGDALGLLGGIAGLGEGGLAVLPPDHEFLKVAYHRDKLFTIDLGHTWGGQFGRRGRLDTLFAGCSHGNVSRARVYTRCTPTYTEVYYRCT